MFIIFSVSDRSDSILELTGNNFLSKFHLFSLYMKMTDECISNLRSMNSLILIWSINFVISILGIANKTKQLYIPPNFKERERSVDLELFVTKEKE